ncbi:MAG TPA: hypothetical protein VJ783_01985 [Pirellulales bacterium]|nr:hypothetical protein [Pirellulales bacterium]
MTQQTLFDAGPSFQFRNRATKAVTFQGKLSRPIHRWYRLTASFSPQLADDIAAHFGLGANDLVLDPFSGVGTVPLCMRLRGIPAWSVEINPYLHFVSTVKNRAYEMPDLMEACVQPFLRHAKRAIECLPPARGARSYLRDHWSYVPRIKNPERWWSLPNLMQLVCLRKAITEEAVDDSVQLDFLRMGILAILVPVSNAKHNHVSLTFADKPQPQVDVWQVLAQKFSDMLADIRTAAGIRCAPVTVFRGNSKELAKVLPSNQKPSAVITSPPYPNRFSYARETRPHLFFFDFVTDPRSVGTLETDAIGGTWGKATSVLAEGVEPKNTFLAKLLAPYRAGVPVGGSLMASYVVKYFNDVYAHAEQVAAVCSPNARLAYVIGNSKFYENPLPSDELLAEVFKQFGFRLDGIERMRRRQSKSGLYEAVVFMSRRAT